MTAPFVHDNPHQRVVFAPGAVERVSDEAARLKLERALVVATPGSGARLGQRLVGLLGARAAGLHAQAVVHVPKRVAETGVAAARSANADGVVAAGGGAAVGLAKIIARDLGLPILAVPTTYSGSEATPIWGMTDGDKKFTGTEARVVPRTILYDPDLTLALPPKVSAASGLNALAHCIGGLFVPNRTPVTMALAADAARRFAHHLPRAVADGGNREARGECLIAAWLAGTVLNAGTWLAAQACPCARRARHAACRDARDHPAAHHPLLPRGRAGGARSSGRSVRHRRPGRPAGRDACGIADPAAAVGSGVRPCQDRAGGKRRGGVGNNGAARRLRRGCACAARGGLLTGG